MKASGINAIDLYVDDIGCTVSFFCEALGFEDAGESGPGHMLKLGELHVYVEGGYARPEGPDNVGGVVPVLACDSVGKMYEHLREQDVAVGEYQQYGPEFAMFRFEDPAGNRWSFAGEP